MQVSSDQQDDGKPTATPKKGKKARKRTLQSPHPRRTVQKTRGVKRVAASSEPAAEPAAAPPTAAQPAPSQNPASDQQPASSPRTGSSGRQLRPAAILGGVRIPFVKQNTAYAEIGNKEMGIKAMASLVERFDLAGRTVGDVAFGAVIKHSRDWNLAREIVLSSGLSPHSPGITLQRACATSLDAAIMIANKIAVGQIEVGIAGGSDTTSDVPIVFKRSFAKKLLEASRTKSSWEKVRTLAGIRPGDLAPSFPGVDEPRTGKSMGEHTEMMAKQWGISREAQDEFALRSHQRAQQAYEEGFYEDLVVPFRGVKKDGIVRADTSLEKLGKLPPAFDKASGKGTLTAGNSSPLSDGASTALLANADWARAEGHEIQAYLTHSRTFAVDYVNGEALLIAPAYAMARLFEATGLGFDDFDYIEIHEAFAAQVLATLKAWESDEYCREKLGAKGALGSVDPAKLNTVGSSLALGHPFAATGTRVLATAAKLLHKRGGERALISVCTAGGMGVVAVVEREA